MPSYEFVTVDVFTDQRFGGNPLAVFPDAGGLSDAQMQALAAEFNLSETTFVLPPENPQHHARVRIFTPRAELPFAGHPNVGTGYVLARRERPARTLHLRGICRPRPRAHPARRRRPDFRRAGFRAALAVDRHRRSADVSPPASACARRRRHHRAHAAGRLGRHAVRDRRIGDVEALSRATPDIAAFRAAAERFPEIGGRFALLLYARLDGDATRLRTRMFAPLGGILEDPATGSANAALAALLTSLAPGENVDLHLRYRAGRRDGPAEQDCCDGGKTAEGPVTRDGRGELRAGAARDGRAVANKTLPPGHAGVCMQR